jgi:glycosyltransferase involved in cell wall biosynthesis
MKIYYLTRSYPPFDKGGGAILRQGAVERLRSLGWEVTVVMPNYGSGKWEITDKLIRIPFLWITEAAVQFERLGILEDYLDGWISRAFRFLKTRVKKEEIVFATSGGELAPIKLGSKIKEATGCRFVVNYRDPLIYATYDGKRIRDRFHIDRDKQEKKYISNADLILTSSESFGRALSGKYPALADIIHTNYFGYLPVDGLSVKDKRVSDGKLHIAYAGRIGPYQKPEILIDSVSKTENRDNIELFFIGDFNKYGPVKKLKNVNLISHLPRNKFIEFMSEKIDIGFVSLTDDFFGFCVPSKIYEYINLGIPILAALAEGDGLKILKEYNYGIGCYFKDSGCLAAAMDEFFEPGKLEYFRSAIMKDRQKWSMDQTIKFVNDLLLSLIG